MKQKMGIQEKIISPFPGRWVKEFISWNNSSFSNTSWMGIFRCCNSALISWIFIAETGTSISAISIPSFTDDDDDDDSRNKNVGRRNSIRSNLQLVPPVTNTFLFMDWERNVFVVVLGGGGGGWNEINSFGSRIIIQSNNEYIQYWYRQPTLIPIITRVSVFIVGGFSFYYYNVLRCVIFNTWLQVL